MKVQEFTSPKVYINLVYSLSFNVSILFGGAIAFGRPYYQLLPYSIALITLLFIFKNIPS